MKRLTWHQQHILKCLLATFAFMLVALVVADVTSQGGIRAGLRGATHCTIWTNADGTTTRHYTRGFPKFEIQDDDSRYLNDYANPADYTTNPEGESK